MGTPQRIRLHPIDNVEVAVDPDDPLRGHKFALVDIDAGAAVVKLGEQIGRVAVAIAAGDHVHGHNLEPAREPVGVRSHGKTRSVEKTPRTSKRVKYPPSVQT